MPNSACVSNMHDHVSHFNKDTFISPRRASPLLAGLNYWKIYVTGHQIRRRVEAEKLVPKLFFHQHSLYGPPGWKKSIQVDFRTVELFIRPLTWTTFRIFARNCWCCFCFVFVAATAPAHDILYCIVCRREGTLHQLVGREDTLF